MRQINKKITIFSVSTTENTQYQNDINTELAKNFLKSNGLVFEEVQGFYKGVSERSFLVVHNDSDVVIDRLVVCELAKQYNQESVLFSDENRRTTLLYLRTDEKIDLGTMKYVESTKGLSSWTKTSAGIFSTEG